MKCLLLHGLVIALVVGVTAAGADSPYHDVVLSSSSSVIQDEGLVENDNNSRELLEEATSIPVLETEQCESFVDFMNNENDRLTLLNDETLVRFVCHAFQRKMLENILIRMEGSLRGTRNRRALQQAAQEDEETLALAAEHSGGENGIVAYNNGPTDTRHLLGEQLPRECVKAYEHRLASQKEKLYEVLRSGKKCKDEVRLELQNFRNHPRIGTSPFLDAYTGADVLP